MIKVIVIKLLFITGFAGSNILCPNYWISFGNSCYQFSTFKTSWFHAAKNCTDIGAHLVAIETQQENTFLTNTVKQLHAHEATTYIDYWTSGNDLASEGSWVWGYPEGANFTFTMWQPGEPNNFQHDGIRSEECLQLRGVYSFTWNDIVCTENDFFICELELNMCADRAMWLVSVLMLYDDVDFAALIVTRFYSS